MQFDIFQHYYLDKKVLLGKSWAEKFPCLKFASKNEDDEVN